MPLSAAQFRSEMPTGLSLTEQMTFCIGHLVMSWSQCESLFFGLLSCFIQGEQGQAQIVWLNTNSSRAMALYVQRLAIASTLDRSIVDQIKAHVKDFKSVTTTRNMFCHARYEADYKTDTLTALESYDLVDDERIYVTSRREAGTALINECINAIVECSLLNPRIWGTLATVRELTGAKHLAMPAELHDYLVDRGIRPASGTS